MKVFEMTLWFLVADSPKHLGKASEKYGKGSQALFAPSKPLQGRNIVVVSQKSMIDGGEDDADLHNLQVTTSKICLLFQKEKLFQKITNAQKSSSFSNFQS